MVAHRLFQSVFPGRAELPEHRVERVELEEIAVPSYGWTWTTVPALLPVVQPVARAGRWCHLVLLESGRGRRDVVEQPVNVGGRRRPWIGCVRIIDDQCQADRIVRHAAPH